MYCIANSRLFESTYILIDLKLTEVIRQTKNSLESCFELVLTISGHTRTALLLGLSEDMYEIYSF